MNEVNIFELSFVGSVRGLMDYLLAICPSCLGKGFVEKTEWVGTDDSYEVSVRCVCNED